MVVAPLDCLILVANVPIPTPANFELAVFEKSFFKPPVASFSVADCSLFLPTNKAPNPPILRRIGTTIEVDDMLAKMLIMESFPAFHDSGSKRQVLMDFTRKR